MKFDLCTNARSYLDGVEPGVLLDQPEQVLYALQRSGGAARLEDEPPLGDEH